MDTTQNTIPELCAPAGNRESFFAAVEAGADAIYCGVGAHNARLRAQNFDIQTLAALTEFAHERGVRVYATVNTLVKQRELTEVASLLYGLHEAKVDAAIIQDAGVLRVLRTEFPALKIHASTQMAIHNSEGVDFLSGYGIRRVVLARELSIGEIAEIVSRTDAEIEVFGHGALCYSISGLCLASSYCGGMSANRGRCAQACRRRYGNAKTGRFYFSMKDLCMIDHCRELIRAGVHSIKIEGRMKSAEYVHRVTRAYRDVLDNGNNAERNTQLARQDGGREKTTFFLLDDSSSSVLQSRQAGATGRFIGKVAGTKKEWITIVPAHIDVRKKDKVRIQPKNGEQGFSASVLAVDRKKKQLSLKVDIDIRRVRSQDRIFLTSEYSLRRMLNKAAQRKLPRVSVRIDKKRIQKIVQPYQKADPHKAKRRTKPRILIKLDSLKWFSFLNQKHIDGCILSCTRRQIQGVLRDSKLMRAWKNKMWVQLPPVVYGDECNAWKALLIRCRKSDIRSFFVSNMAHFALTARNDLVCWDGMVSGCMNNAAILQLEEFGCDAVACAMEDDRGNISRCHLPNGMAYIYGYVPACISRVESSLKPGTEVNDPRGVRYRIGTKYGLTWLLGAKPLCLFRHQDGLEQAGIQRVIIDLSFLRPSRNIVQNLLNSYKDRRSPKGTQEFNFCKGLT